MHTLALRLSLLWICYNCTSASVVVQFFCVCQWLVVSVCRHLMQLQLLQNLKTTKLFFVVTVLTVCHGHLKLLILFGRPLRSRFLLYDEEENYFFAPF